MWKFFLLFYAALAVSMFWVLASNTTEPRPSKREFAQTYLFVLIIQGGLVGGAYLLLDWLLSQPWLMGLLLLLLVGFGLIFLAFKALIAVLDFIRGP